MSAARRARVAVVAALDGVRTALTRPALVAAVYLASVIVAAAFGLAMEPRLVEVFGAPETASPSGYLVDLEEWDAFRRRVPWLGDTLSPAVLGVAAPLDSWAALLDGRLPAAVVLVASALFSVAWLFLLGGILETARRRGHHRAPLGFLAGCRRHILPFLALAAGLAIYHAVLWLVVNPLLLQPVSETLATGLPEGAALAARLPSYALFAALIAVAHLGIEYARIHVVFGAPILAALRDGFRFLTRRAVEVGVLGLLGLAALAGLLAAYAAFELGTSGVALSNRALAVAQGVLVARAFLQVAAALARLRLVEASRL